MVFGLVAFFDHSEDSAILAAHHAWKLCFCRCWGLSSLAEVYFIVSSN